MQGINVNVYTLNRIRLQISSPILIFLLSANQVAHPYQTSKQIAAASMSNHETSNLSKIYDCTFMGKMRLAVNHKIKDRQTCGYFVIAQ